MISKFFILCDVIFSLAKLQENLKFITLKSERVKSLPLDFVAP